MTLVLSHAVEAEINSLNQVAAGSPAADNWLGEMLDACDAADAWGGGQGSIPANSLPAGNPVPPSIAMPHVPLDWDAVGDDPQALNTITTFSSLAAQHEDSSGSESHSL